MDASHPDSVQRYRVAPTITYPSSTYSWTAGAGRPGNSTITGTDSAGNTGTSVLAFVRDNAAPNGGALQVNGTNATVAGSTSFNRTGSFTLTRTDYTDALSGMLRAFSCANRPRWLATLCGAFGSAVPRLPVRRTVRTDLRVLPVHAHGHRQSRQRRQSKHDRQGRPRCPDFWRLNRQRRRRERRRVPPARATQLAFAINARTDWTDAESGLASSVLTRAQATLTAGTCGTYGATTTLVGTPAQTGLTTGCYRYQLIGTDNAGNTSTITTVVRYDVTAPTGGALTVNGVAASGAGTTSTVNGPSFTIGTRTDFTDAAAGIASSVLTREFATLTGTTCGAFGAADHAGRESHPDRARDRLLPLSAHRH